MCVRAVRPHRASALCVRVPRRLASDRHEDPLGVAVAGLEGLGFRV